MRISHMRQGARITWRVEKTTYIEQSKRLTTLLRDQTYVSKYELGERRLDVLELREVCEAIGVGLEEFVKRLEKVL
jgi:transcriptional regulator with XRE-family HTH domain